MFYAACVVVLEKLTSLSVSSVLSYHKKGELFVLVYFPVPFHFLFLYYFCYIYFNSIYVIIYVMFCFRIFSTPIIPGVV